MEKINLTAQQIFDKTFNIEIKGYAPKEVDEFIDLMLEDYDTFNSIINELKEKINKLEDENNTLKAENLDLQGRQKVFDLSNTTSYSSVDLLKRVSRLEEVVFKK